VDLWGLCSDKAEKYREAFIDAIKDKVGYPYILAGGTGSPYVDPKTGISYSNKDIFGNWKGYDCSGGVNASLAEATGLTFKQRGASGLSEAPFVKAINEKNLQAGDLIFINNPTNKKDKKGNIIYEGIGHVLTYVGESKVVTTNGNENGNSADIRINPASQVITMCQPIAEFRKQNQDAYPGAIWTYGRIDWEQLAE
jgi:cell wall-associated NlpC family hydrolase